MQPLICMALLLIVPGSTLEQSGTKTAATLRQEELVHLAEQRFKAFFEGDKTTYERLVSKDAVFAYSNGRTLNYVEALSELAPLAKAGTYSFHYEDIQFRDFGNSALLVYRLVFSGPPAIGDYQGVESDTFARHNNAWKLIAVHGTSIPYPERTSTTVSSDLLEEYVGRYEKTPEIYYDITCEGKQLMGQRNGYPKVPWLAESSDIFYIPSDPTASRVFMRDSKGGICKLVRVDVEGNTVWTRVK
jgi:hypothetical protein